MSVWGFTADLEELELVCSLLAYASPVETQGDGVWVSSVNGGRIWSVSTDTTIWEACGDPVEFPMETRCIPGRAVWEARIFAITSNSHEVHFSIPDDLVCLVSSDVGTSVIDLPRNNEAPSFPMYVAESAVAKTTAGAFFDLLLRARMVPLGPSNDDYPDAHLIVENGAIAVFVDWSIRNALRGTYRIPADITGEASCVLPMGPVYDVIREQDRDQNITLHIPARPDLPLLIEGGLFRAAIKCPASGAARHHEELLRTLVVMPGCRVHEIERGSFGLSTRSREFRVELIDQSGEMISICTEVCRNVELNIELLTQINEANGALVGSRLWTRDNVVWAGFDLPVSALSELEQSIETLDRQLAGFDVFLTGFSAA